MVRLTCQHWYCHGDLRGEPRFTAHIFHNMLTETDAIRAPCDARTPFQCCQQIATAEQVRTILDPNLLATCGAMWEELREANPTYCHRPQCGTFPPGRLATSPDSIRCQRCHYETCRHCKGPSHAGRECQADFATQQARTLASRSGWKACPRCHNMIEKSGGCMHMTCRCGAGFCYRCGRLLSECGDRCTA